MLMTFSNNPDVAREFPSSCKYLETDVMGIFNAVRDAVHTGARLISHPLSGSVKPNESPYKSVVVDVVKEPLDFKSLQIIEDAITTLKKLPLKNREYSGQVLEDFRVIDLDLIMSAFPKGYI